MYFASNWACCVRKEMLDNALACMIVTFDAGQESIALYADHHRQFFAPCDVGVLGATRLHESGGFGELVCAQSRIAAQTMERLFHCMWVQGQATRRIEHYVFEKLALWSPSVVESATANDAEARWALAVLPAAPPERVACG